MTAISRRRALTLLTVGTAATLTGCSGPPGWANGFSTGFGRSAEAGALGLRNIVAVSAVDGRATLLTTIFNGKPADDALIGLDLAGGVIALRPRIIALPGNGMAVIGGASSLSEKPSTAILIGVTVKAGYFVRLTYTFAKAPPVEVGALVVKHRGPYDAVPLPQA